MSDQHSQQKAAHFPRLALGLAALAMVCSAAANAQTLDQRTKYAQDREQLAQYAKRVNAACGTHIAFSINYASYTNAPAPAASVRKAVAGKIKSVVGMFTEGEEESLSNGVFTYKIGWSGGNVDNPENWLKAHL